MTTGPKPQPPPPNVNEEDVLRRLLAMPPDPKIAPKSSAKKSKKPAKK
jgi:hypothetical protein